MPPLHLRTYIGPGEDLFIEIGDHLATLLQETGGLTERDDVLDVGCGSGRLARPLAAFLSRKARYEGFDISADAIKWCQRNIARKHPNFGFTHADIANTHYNPEGRLTADTFAFPYSDSSFDFVFATSVFTHMLPAGVDRYIAEITRVLRPGGRFLVTAFVWNADVADRNVRDELQVSFQFDFGHYRTSTEDLEAVVAYDEQDLLSRLQAGPLRPIGEIHTGSWTGRDPSECATFQDVIVLRNE